MSGVDSLTVPGAVVYLRSFFVYQHPPWEKVWKETVRIDEESDPSLGCPPDKRSLEMLYRFGLVNLDKPSGPSSHEVVAWVKRILGLKHAGHGGTLEAGVAGEIPWLLVCFL